jgi:hypothetical protein
MEPKKPAEKPVDRFAALTKRLLTVPKKELREDDKQTEQDEPKSRHQKRKEQRRANLRGPAHSRVQYQPQSPFTVGVSLFG